jgi:hypothetical protein
MAVNTQTNLPSTEIQDSAARTKLFFDTYGVEPLSYVPAEVDATINFFEKRGFAKDSAITAAAVLLKQAKLESLPIYKILDDITGLESLDLSALVAEILNNNRSPISTLGFKQPLSDVNKQRNVLA